MDIENLYETIKTLLPYAPQFLPNDQKIKNALKQVNEVVNMIESMGGFKTLSQMFNLETNDQNQQNNDVIEHLENSPSVDSFKKIKQL